MTRLPIPAFTEEGLLYHAIHESWQIGVTDFTFTESSESLLIDMVGDGANGILRDAFVGSIPSLSDAALRRIEMELKPQTDSFLAKAVRLGIRHASPQRGDQQRKAVSQRI